MKSLIDQLSLAMAQFSNPYDEDIVALARDNTAFRNVVITGDHMQVVLMSLLPGEDIGMETHPNTDQTLLFVRGTGHAEIDGLHKEVHAGSLGFVPAGTPHNRPGSAETHYGVFTAGARAWDLRAKEAHTTG